MMVLQHAGLNLRQQ